MEAGWRCNYCPLVSHSLTIFKEKKRQDIDVTWATLFISDYLSLIKNVSHQHHSNFKWVTASFCVFRTRSSIQLTSYNTIYQFQEAEKGVNALASGWRRILTLHCTLWCQLLFQLFLHSPIVHFLILGEVICTAGFGSRYIGEGGGALQDSWRVGIDRTARLRHRAKPLTYCTDHHTRILFRVTLDLLWALPKRQ